MLPVRISRISFVIADRRPKHGATEYGRIHVENGGLILAIRSIGISVTAEHQACVHVIGPVNLVKSVPHRLLRRGAGTGISQDPEVNRFVRAGKWVRSKI